MVPGRVTLGGVTLLATASQATGYSVTVLQYYIVTVLQYYSITVLQYCSITVLHCYSVTVL